MNMRKLIILMIFVAVSATAWAQQECAFVLEESQELFDAGLIETIPGKLSGCLEKGFTREEKLQAYKLVILSYLFDDDIERADAYMARFLDDFPAYEPVATDPNEFVLLLETYDREPLMTYGGGLGSNLSFAYPVQVIGTHNTSLSSGSYVPGRAGFHIGAHLTRKINSTFRLKAELNYSNTGFSHQLGTEEPGEVMTGEITDYSKISYHENQNWIRLPLGVMYGTFTSNFNVYVSAGCIPGLLLGANSEAQRDYQYTGDIRYDPISVSNVGISALRRRLNLWAFAGGGIQYDFGTGIAFLGVRYHLNLFSQSPPGVNYFKNQELLWEVYYVPDNIFLHQVSATAGFMFPIYRPKKRTE